MKEDDLSRVDQSALSDRQDLPRKSQPEGSQDLCACKSDDAERCIALRYPYAHDLTDDGEPERCECSCHDFQRYDE